MNGNMKNQLTCIRLVKTTAFRSHFIFQLNNNFQMKIPCLASIQAFTILFDNSPSTQRTVIITLGCMTNLHSNKSEWIFNVYKSAVLTVARCCVESGLDYQSSNNWMKKCNKKHFRINIDLLRSRHCKISGIKKLCYLNLKRMEYCGHANLEQILP